MWGELFSGLGTGLVEVVVASAPMLLSGAVMKHGIKKLPNDLIPVVNGVLGVGIAYQASGDVNLAVQTGVAAATGAIGTHQLLKIGTRKLLGGLLSNKIGPGDRLSI